MPNYCRLLAIYHFKNYHYRNLYALALMSVRNALQFIVRLRADETLRKRLVCPDDAPELGSFFELGGKIGLSFTIEELRTAHKHDWGMRYLLYNRSDLPSGS